MLIWLFIVNLLYSFLIWMLFPSLVYLWISPIIVSLVLIGLGLDLQEQTPLLIAFKGVQQYAITFLWFLILIWLGILLYSLWFGIYSLIVLLILNIALFLVSFLIGYNEGKQVFFRWLIASLIVLWFLWVREGGGVIPFLIMGFWLIVGVLSFLFFVVRNWVDVEDIYKWYLITSVVVLGFWDILYLREWEATSLIFVGLASQIYILVILVSFWVLRKNYDASIHEDEDVDKPDLEEVIKTEGIAPFFKFKKKLPQKKGQRWIYSVLDLWINLPEWVKTLMWITNFVGFSIVLATEAYLLIKTSMHGSILPYLLSLLLFVVNLFLLFVLWFYRWRYRFLLAFLLNAMGYVIIYYFLNQNMSLLSASLIAWSFAVLGFYRFLWTRHSEWNIFREDILVGIIFNTFFVIINVVTIALITSFPLLQKIWLILTYIWIYGLWIYYLWKISLVEEEVILSEVQDSF